MKVIFFCYNFSKANLRLMPWKYIYEAAKGLGLKDHEVSILSGERGGNQSEETIEGIRAVRINLEKTLSGKVALNLFEQADVVIWSSSTPTPVWYRRLKAFKKPLILLFTGPFYTISEVLQAQKHNIPIRQLIIYYRNAIVPLSFTVGLVRADFVCAAVVLSRKNAQRLRDKGCPAEKLNVILPGFEKSLLEAFEEPWNEEAREKVDLCKGRKIVTYLGPLSPIRGVNVLLDAFHRISEKSDEIQLLILARTDSQREIEALRTRVDSLAIGQSTSIIPGFLERGRVWEYLRASDMVVFPFLLVPSDMPLAVLEAMALGKPVITTQIDGMPEMVGKGGIIIRPGESESLAQAILSLSRDQTLYNSLRDQCLSNMASHPSWQEVVDKFQSLLQQYV